MTSPGRIRGTAWIHLCDSCSLPLSDEGARWRRRHLCPDCAEKAIRQDMAHASMMLGNVGRRRKEESARRRREKEAAHQRERRLREKAAEELETQRRQAVHHAEVRAHVEDMMNEPPVRCDVCGAERCTRHPDAAYDEAER